MGREIAIDLLGSLVVRVDGRETVIAAFKPRALLAALALQPATPVAMHQLGAVLWGEQPAARGLVHTYVRRLRRALGPDVVATVADGYRLDVDPDRVDLHRFRHLAAAGELAAALRLWRGAPFADLRCDHLERAVAPGIVEELLRVLERRIDADLAADGSAAGLVAELRELTARYPLRESLWLRLLDALRRDGRTAEALAAYGTLRTRLADELGVDPSERLQQAHRALLIGDPPPRSTPAPQPAAAAPALPVPRQLPCDIAHFRGRCPQLERLDRLADEAADRRPVIATIAGPAGVGKTALAVHWAHRVGARFPDGTLYVDLRGFGPGEAVPAGTALESFLRALNVPASAIPPQDAARTALLRSTLADRRVLMVLDNARDADQVRPLLPGGGAWVLVTSRNQLAGLCARDGAVRIELSGMSTERCLELLGAGDRVAADPPAAHALVELCGRLPLPLRVLGERLGRDRHLALADVLADLRDERIGLDAFPDDDQASDVRAVFSWSYQTLPEAAAQLFRLLGACPAHEIGLAAAGALAGQTAPRVRRAVDRLVAINLLQPRGRDRWGLHDLLRTYAAELADQEPAETAAALTRLTDWCVDGAIVAKRAQASPAWGRWYETRSPARTDEFTDPRAWFRAEVTTLLAVFERARRAGDDGAVVELGRPLVFLLWCSQRWTDQRAVAHVLVAAARRVHQPDAEFVALHALLTAAAHQEPVGAARRWDAPLLDAARRAQDRVLLMRAYCTIGLTTALDGDPDAALAPAQTAVDIAGELYRPTYLARCESYLAVVHTWRGRPDLALQLAQRALAVQRQLGEEEAIADTLAAVGSALTALGRPDEGIAYFQEAIAVADRLGKREVHGEVLRRLGQLYAGTGRPREARESWQQALEILTGLGAAKVTPVVESLAQLDGA